MAAGIGLDLPSTVVVSRGAVEAVLDAVEPAIRQGGAPTAVLAVSMLRDAVDRPIPWDLITPHLRDLVDEATVDGPPNALDQLHAWATDRLRGLHVDLNDHRVFFETIVVLSLVCEIAHMSRVAGGLEPASEAHVFQFCQTLAAALAVAAPPEALS